MLAAALFVQSCENPPDRGGQSKINEQLDRGIGGSANTASPPKPISPERSAGVASSNSLDSHPWDELAQLAKQNPSDAAEWVRRGANELKDPQSRSAFYVKAMWVLSPLLPPAAIVEIVENQTDGRIRSEAYSSVYSELRGEPEKLRELLAEMPPGDVRGAGYQTLYKGEYSGLQQYREALRTLDDISEPEDLRGAVLGLAQARSRLASEKGVPAEALLQAEQQEVSSEYAQRLFRMNSIRK
jgi:hypothetical protein